MDPETLTEAAARATRLAHDAGLLHGGEWTLLARRR